MRRRIQLEQTPPLYALWAGARRSAQGLPGRCPGTRHIQDGDWTERHTESLAVELFLQVHKIQTNPVLPQASLEELEK